LRELATDALTHLLNADLPHAERVRCVEEGGVRVLVAGAEESDR
jgi:hypothetical protein